MTLKDWTKSGEYEWHKYHENGKKQNPDKTGIYRRISQGYTVIEKKERRENI